MNYRNKYDGIDSELVKIVRNVARRAIGKSGLTLSDLPDIEQELMLSTLKALRSFRKDAGNKNAFISRVVNNRLKSILRSRHSRSKNWYCCCVSLNIMINLDNGDFDELITLVASDHLLRNNSCRWANPHLDMDIAEGLNNAVKQLPEQLREFCEELKEKTFHEIRRDGKISTTGIYRNIARIRKELKKLELFAGASPCSA